MIKLNVCPSTLAQGFDSYSPIALMERKFRLFFLSQARLRNKLKQRRLFKTLVVFLYRVFNPSFLC